MSFLTWWNFLIDKGVKGLFAGGTTGEGVALDVDERKKLHEVTISAANGRVPVLVHVGAMRMIRPLILHAMRLTSVPMPSLL